MFLNPGDNIFGLSGTDVAQFACDLVRGISRVFSRMQSIAAWHNAYDSQRGDVLLAACTARPETLCYSLQ